MIVFLFIRGLKHIKKLTHTQTVFISLCYIVIALLIYFCLTEKFDFSALAIYIQYNLRCKHSKIKLFGIELERNWYGTRYCITSECAIVNVHAHYNIVV